jgi:hypothetical protein
MRSDRMRERRLNAANLALAHAVLRDCFVHHNSCLDSIDTVANLNSTSRLRSNQIKTPSVEGHCTLRRFLTFQEVLACIYPILRQIDIWNSIIFDAVHALCKTPEDPPMKIPGYGTIPMACPSCYPAAFRLSVDASTSC